jgi:hypothetical protein
VLATKERALPPERRQDLTRRAAVSVAQLLLPLLAIALSVLVWISSVSRTGFWADDFINLTHYSRSLGDLSDETLNKGKYVINVFWALGTDAFGNGSAIPFLLLTTAIFATGLIVWLRVGSASRWRGLDAWWICGLFIATGVWFPIALWSSNITHSAAFLALGLGLLAHERCMRAQAIRGALLWSLACGASWLLAVASNLLYFGLLAIAVYCVLNHVSKLEGLGLARPRAMAAVGAWNLAIPIVYFATIAYPATTASSVYAHSDLSFAHANFRYYRAELAPTTLLSACYIAVLVLAIAGATAAIRRRDWFPAAVLVASGATAFPAFIQSQQRGVQYLAMSLLLLLSAFASGARPALLAAPNRRAGLSAGLLAAAVVMLALVFGQGSNIRSYYTQTPMGASLERFRAEVAAITPASGDICASLNLSTAEQELLSAELSGEDGFLVPPIDAARAYLVAPGQRCPAEGASTHITVTPDGRGGFQPSKS